MTEPKKPISGPLGRARAKIIDEQVTKAVRGTETRSTRARAKIIDEKVTRVVRNTETRFARGRVGVSKAKSPKKLFVPKKEDINPHIGAYGEKAYGTPMSKKPLLGKAKK